jgi:hypothetical protein
MKSLIRLNGLCIATALIVFSSQVTAGVCDPFAGTGEVALEGSTVCFVYDPADIDPLFGSLQVSDDNIFVLPTNFKAESVDGAGTSIVSGTGSIQIIAKVGYILDGVNVGERGDYKLNGAGSSVDVDAWLRVFDWFDPTPVFGTEETTNLSITGPLNIIDNNLHDWSADGGFDLTTALWDDRDHIGLTLQNTLTATSGSNNGDLAFIQKKAIGSEIIVSIDTSPVIPVPAAVWLFGSGLLGLVGIARRKKA